MVDRRTLTDEAFIQSTQAAFKAELAVAYTCVCGGAVEVSVPNYRIRPTFEERSQYRDPGDLFVRWKHGEELRRYEVKQRNLQFTCAADFPWPTIMVDETANLDQKDPYPYGYFICNAPLDTALFIRLDSAPLYVVTKYDRRYKQDITSYVVPKLYAVTVPLQWN